MTLLSGCASGLGGDAACSATLQPRRDLAGALVEDGGPMAKREGLELITVLDKICVDT